MDIQVGDVVRFWYMRFGNQIFTTGTVIEELETGGYIVDSGYSEVEVDKAHIDSRSPRADEMADKKPVKKADPEDQLNVGVTGVRFRRRKNVKKN